VFSAVGISTCALAQGLIDKISKDGHIHRSVTDRDRRLIDEILRLVREASPVMMTNMASRLLPLHHAR